jgi:3-oxoacyl-[acyl-carrier-protein] synthase-3
MEFKMIGKVEGTGSCIPAQVWDNNRLSEMVDTNDEWIRERTGIARRHVASDGETTAVLAAGAAKAALEDAGMDAAELDLIIVATVSPGMLVPCTACEVQRLIGADNATCFDLNGACTGFMLALNTAQAYLAQGVYRTALIVGAECLSNLVDWSDRSTCILFGDGAGAAVLRAQEAGIHAQVTHSTGQKGGVLTCASRNRKTEEMSDVQQEDFIRMDGGEVFKFAVSKVPEVIRELLQREALTTDKIDYFILHQANARIVSAVAKRLGENPEKFPMNMSEYGNTSSASIPILLDELNRAGKLKRGMKLVLAGFGGGLSYGASLIVW